MSAAIQHIPLRLPRHNVSPRQVARAGDIWRLFQEAAVIAADNVGWSGARFITERVGFVVSRMTVLHHRELSYGEAVQGRTWLRDWRRDTISRREIRLDVAGQGVATATQQWVHVSLGEGVESISPTRASAGLLADFQPVDGVAEDSPVLPPVAEAVHAGTHRLHFDVWHTWMDPFAHVNHPMYVDWFDESAARLLIRAGLDPQDLVPVAEQVRFKRGLIGGCAVVVETQVKGFTAAGDVVLQHRVETIDGVLAADGITVRRMVDQAGLGVLAELS